MPDAEQQLASLLDAAHDLRMAGETIRGGSDHIDALERWDRAEDRYDAAHARYHEHGFAPCGDMSADDRCPPCDMPVGHSERHRCGPWSWPNLDEGTLPPRCPHGCQMPELCNRCPKEATSEGRLPVTDERRAEAKAFGEALAEKYGRDLTDDPRVPNLEGRLSTCEHGIKVGSEECRPCTARAYGTEDYDVVEWGPDVGAERLEDGLAPRWKLPGKCRHCGREATVEGHGEPVGELVWYTCFSCPEGRLQP